MTLIFYGIDFKYEIEGITKLFFPAVHFNFLYNEDCIGDKIITKCIEEDGAYLLEASVFIGGEGNTSTMTVNSCGDDDKNRCELILCRMLYSILTQLTEICVPWGLLTGIRPVKRVNKLLSEGFSEDDVRKEFSGKYLVSDEKTELSIQTSKIQKELFKIPDKSFSLYISIPFCPTRCSYCSFVSHSIDSAGKLIPEYIEKLSNEIKIIGDIANKLSLNIDTIYFGGGTPTAISAEDIQILMNTVNNNFDLSKLREYTVEAGRADTITEEKLRVIKNYGATRISINPQTMNDSVLQAIGRKHTAEQVLTAYNIARRLGLNNINMDLIAGLPTETVESFINSVDTLRSLNPENITVHTLSLKRSSELFQKHQVMSANSTSEMVSYANKTLNSAEYGPYYLYRQKNTIGNLENVGYAKKGYESLYNVYIMEEIQSIFAAGAAASTKLINGNDIKRVYNYKFPYEYIGRFEELMKRKQEIINFYNGGK